MNILSAPLAILVDAVSYLIEALLDSGVGFVSASRFPVQDGKAMSLTSLVGNIFLSAVMSVLFLRRIRDSQSGMWIFYRKSLERMNLESDGMAFSEEIKIEALRNQGIGFKEIPIRFSNREGEKKLQPWRDGWNNLFFLLRKRFYFYKFNWIFLWIALSVIILTHVHAIE